LLDVQQLNSYTKRSRLAKGDIDQLLQNKNELNELKHNSEEIN